MENKKIILEKMPADFFSDFLKKKNMTFEEFAAQVKTEMEDPEWLARIAPYKGQILQYMENLLYGLDRAGLHEDYERYKGGRDWLISLFNKNQY